MNPTSSSEKREIELSAQPASIEIHKVDKIFTRAGHPPVQALDGVSFTIREGETVAVLGPSGCGKSTLLRILAQLDTPSRGEVFRNVPGLFRAGVVFQDSRLLPWRSVAGNIRFAFEGRDGAPENAESRIAKVLELVDLTAFAERHPHELSGGMQQRVALARALVIEPQLLLMDEPFAALDALTRAHLQEEVASIVSRARRTVLLITHDIDESLLLADRVLVMSPRPGRILAEHAIDLARPRSVGQLLDAEPIQRIKRRILELLRSRG